MKNYNKLLYSRVDQSLNIILIITAVICFLGSFFLYTAGFLMVYSLLNFISGLILLVVFIMAKKIKTANKIIIMIILAAIIAVASYIGGSFSSPFITLLLLANLIAILFLEAKTSIIISFLFVILMFALGFYSLVISGSTDSVTWSLHIIAYILFIIVVHISIYVIKNYLIENIKNLEKAMVKSNQLAYYDQLTKLPNVYKFKEDVEAFIMTNQKDGFILLFSLKSLNLINSTLGYEMGNQTLIEVTSLFKDLIGNQGFVAKTGGNEFAIWMDHLTEKECYAKFSKVIDDLKAENNGFKKKLEFHSVFARFVYGQETFDDCYQKAILTLTYAKNNNRQGLVLYNDKLAFHFKRNERIKELLEKAINHNEISLAYQGKFDVRTSKIVGLEALARWNSPELGKITPNEFIPIIESMNLSTVFGDFVINHVCKDFKKLQEKYNPDISLSLNISPSHIIDPTIIRSMEAALKKYNIPPDRIIIEITEDIIMKGIDEVKPILKALRAMKLKISLDDFGSGYSSLNYLCQLDIDELKIDKSFIDQIEISDRIHILIENIIHLSKHLQLNLVAEGVETKAQNDLLNSLGCYVIQGYYYSKPEALNDLGNDLGMFCLS